MDQESHGHYIPVSLGTAEVLLGAAGVLLGAADVLLGVADVLLGAAEVSLGAAGTIRERMALPAQGQPQTCTENNLLLSPAVSEPLEISRAKIGQVLSDGNLLLE